MPARAIVSTAEGTGLSTVVLLSHSGIGVVNMSQFMIDADTSAAKDDDNDRRSLVNAEAYPLTEVELIRQASPSPATQQMPPIPEPDYSSEGTTVHTSFVAESIVESSSLQHPPVIRIPPPPPLPNLNEVLQHKTESDPRKIDRFRVFQDGKAKAHVVQDDEGPSPTAKQLRDTQTPSGQLEDDEATTSGMQREDGDGQAPPEDYLLTTDSGEIKFSEHLATRAMWPLLQRLNKPGTTTTETITREELNLTAHDCTNTHLISGDLIDMVLELADHTGITLAKKSKFWNQVLNEIEAVVTIKESKDIMTKLMNTRVQQGRPQQVVTIDDVINRLMKCKILKERPHSQLPLESVIAQIVVHLGNYRPNILQDIITTKPAQRADILARHTQ